MKILFILKKKPLCLFLLACIFLSNCNSLTYHSRLVFWNIPSPKDHKKFPRDIINQSNETYHFAKGTESQ